MAKDEVLTVKDAIYKLQLSLLEGIKDENQLFAAGSLMCQGDYQDVVTERSLAKICGYPLCSNPLPSDPPRKGRYRISLKEHKVYDLQETYMYCSTSCVVNSRAFAGTLQEERCSTLNPAKLNKVLKLFEGFSSVSKQDKDKNGDSGFSELKIQENSKKAGEVSLEEWVGPSNSIEGYVPQRDRQPKPHAVRKNKKGSKPEQNQENRHKGVAFGEMDFTSTIITQDEYSVSKSVGQPKSISSTKNEEANSNLSFQELATNVEQTSEKKSEESCNRKSEVMIGLRGSCSEASLVSGMNDLSINESKVERGSLAGSISSMRTEETHESVSDRSTGNRCQITENPAGDEKGILERRLKESNKGESAATTGDNGSASEKSLISGAHNLKANLSEVKMKARLGKESVRSTAVLKSSLKSSGAKNVSRSVTWADEKTSADSGKILSELKESEEKKEATGTSQALDVKMDDDSYRVASAEACARALTEAAEAMASGKSEVTDAVSEAGLIILPLPHESEEGGSEEDNEDTGADFTTLKWPRKPGFSSSNLFDSEDSWYDSPPEGFSLDLSPFATMYMALFGWISSTSLAYIYGHDENSYEDYQYINGMEYPRRIVSADGRSSEIKQTLAGCLARALPGLVSELRLPTPISTLEKEMSCLIDTMSFADPLPPFRMKQWQIIAFLFLDALSVSRILGLTPYLTASRIWLPKILEGAQITREEYESLKDLIIPLGRMPQLTSQSGG